MSKRLFSLTAAAMAMCLLLTSCTIGSSSGSSDISSGSGSVSSAISVIGPGTTSSVIPDPGSSSTVTPDPGSSSTVTPDPGSSSVIPPEPVVYYNPLTGEQTDTDLTAQRPIAVILNNLQKSLPQCGVSQADIIFEAPVEGGITRMMAIFQSADGVGDIGTVRSARPYYVELALGLDAILLHAGGSDSSYDAIENWGATTLDSVNGPYEGTLFWRDPIRAAEDGAVHSLFTSGSIICDLVPTYAKVRQTHYESFSLPLTFTENGTPLTGVTANTISVKYSGSKTGVFTFNPTTGKYLVEEYNGAYMDGNNNQQVSVTNVLVLFTDISRIPGDTAGRLDIRLTGTGTGYYACGGKFIDINWTKPTEDTPFQFTTADGKDLVLGVGSSYINIVDNNYPVTIE